MLSLIKEEKKTISMNTDTVNDYYQAFLNSQSENTAKAYNTANNMLAKLFFNKEMKFVTLEQIRSLKMLDIMKLYNWLNEDIDDVKTGKKKPRYMINTVNKHINGMKSFFKFLNKDFNDINDNIFGNVNLKSPKLDANTWDGLEWKEAVSLWEYAQENFGEMSNQISMIMKLSAITSIRSDALFRLNWNEHWFVKNEGGININYIDIIDKGVSQKKPVSDSFYKELRSKLTGDFLFPDIHKDNINKMLKICLNDLNFDERRNIKFHSFKKAGVMRALDLTDNIYKAKEQGNHSSIATTEGFYLKYKESLSSMVSYSIEQVVDIKSDIEDYSKEELIQAISKLREVSQKEFLSILQNGNTGR